MNPDMTTKLNRIKSALRKSIEMASKSTREPWVNDGPSIRHGYKGRDLIAICSLTYKDYEDRDNAAFLAHARTMTPLACKALLTAIEGLENITCTEGVARNTLESITSEWPDV